MHDTSKIYKKINFRNLILLFIFCAALLIVFLAYKTQNLLDSYSKNLSIKTVQCNSLNFTEYDNVTQNLSDVKLNIRFNNSKKWSVNLLRAYTEQRSGNFIQENFKKRFNADLFVFAGQNQLCKLKARIRLHGDLFDHLDPLKNNSSLDIRILDGHIHNIVRFKLLKPVSRNYENEIFATNLMRNLGFLAPRTAWMSVTVNEKDTNYIFQEYINKEFLENSSKREGPILESDERFEWCLNLGAQYIQKNSDKYKYASKCKNFVEKRQLSRIVNPKWSEKGPTSTYISALALTELNKLYLLSQSSQIAREKENLQVEKHHIDLPIADYFSYGLRKGINGNIENNYIPIFDALMYAMQASHGLHKNERYYYFNPVTATYEPIYYGGMAKFDDLIKSKEKNEKIITPHPFFGVYTKEGASLALKKLNSIALTKLSSGLISSGIELKDSDLKKIINKLKDNLKKLIVSSASLDSSRINLDPLYENIQDSTKKLVFYDYDKKIEKEKSNQKEFIEGILVCDLNITNCKSEKYSLVDLSKILAQRYTTKNNEIDYIFVGKNTKEYLNGEKIYEYIKNREQAKHGIRNWKTIQINKNSKIKINDGINVSLNKKDKNIIFNQINSSGRAVIKGGKIEGWKIFFHGYNDLDNKTIQRFNKEGLTGCITFMDLEINNVNIFSKNSICEDAINFVRTNGIIESIEVSNNHYDGIDADFSSLIFKEILVNKSGNDCLDFSFGKYNIKNTTLNYCFDKAISVGEKSDATFEKIMIKKSNVGVASKDSSKVKIIKGEIIDVNTCLAAYRKKNEFSGAIINVNEIKCSGQLVNKEIGSEISISRTIN